MKSRLAPALISVLGLALLVPSAEATSSPGQGRVSAACRRADEKPGSQPPIVHRVCREIPILGRRGAQVSDLRAVDLIRDWAFRNVDERASGEVALALPDDAWKMSAIEFLRIFDRDTFGARCGEAAWFLMRVYNAFGLEAYIYNFGFQAPTPIHSTTATHVITLVRVDRDLIPEDAHFDQTIRGPHGEPLDFGLVLARLRDPDTGPIRFVRRQPFPERQILLPEASYQRLRPIIGTPGTVARGLHDCVRRGGSWRCTDSWYTYASVDDRDPDYGAPALDRIAAAGWPRSLDYLMMFPLGVSSDSEGWTPLERIAESTPAAAVLRNIYRGIGL